MPLAPPVTSTFLPFSLYPNAAVLTTALRGCTTYRLAWFDAQLCACAECFGISEIVSEDLEHGRHIGRVRIFDPFVAASGQVKELPPQYEATL